MFTWKIKKNVFCKKIFDKFFFFPGFLAKLVVCRKFFVNFDPFPLVLGFLAKLGCMLQENF